MSNKKLNGIILINAFLRPEQSVEQAARMQAEFLTRGVDAKIVSDAFLRMRTEGNSFYNQFLGVDFALFLDKDKYVSGILKNCGIPLFNSHDSIRLCDDKAETYIALCGKEGITVPRTAFAPVCYSADDEIKENYVKEIGNTLGFPLIVKESYGSMGKGVHMAENPIKLRMLIEKLKTVPHMYQEYIGENAGKDVRIITIGGKTVAGMMRKNDSDFRSNVALGGKGVKIDTFGEFSEYGLCAERASKVLGLDYCGIDFLIGKNKEPILCEVNSNAFFCEMEKVTGVNVAGLYAEHIIDKCTRGR